MQSYTVYFVREDIRVSAEAGASLLAVEIAAGLTPDAPCGGKGTCGKCIADVMREGETAYARVKACEYIVDGDLQVRTCTGGDMHILTGGADARTEAVLTESAASDADYAIAFDIGTTTVVGYLLNPAGGREIAVEGMLNPQVQFGADVIARVSYAMENGVGDLSACIRAALNQLIGSLCAGANIRRWDVRYISIAGNTCMHHLFLDISPEPLGKAPYQPVVRDAMLIPAKDCGLEIHPEGNIFVLPVIAGFVGGDTVGCLVSGDWLNREELSLMVDIGTNGELVMGNAGRMIACSTAAGPALEGAKISCGMRGCAGAVEHVWLENGKFCYHVIGDVQPTGVCGSGLIDLAACLLESGEMDETGYLESGSAFELCEGVSITQKDIRELQLAKAAIRAGIELMAEKLGVGLDDIRRVEIAGAFGNYMKAENACKIGLLPDVFLDRIHAVGNAAGAGACLTMMSAAAQQSARDIAAKVEFLELATMPDFQDCFVDALEFPEV